MTARVQLDRYFYRVIDIKQSTQEAKVWLLERDSDSPPMTIYDKRRAAKTFQNADEAAIVNELSNWVVLQHTNILPLIKIARLNFRIAALMELCPGTLDDWIRKRALTWPETGSIMMQVGEALRYAHEEHHLAHLDIKPANVMVKNFPDHVQVADWGISRLTSEGRIASGGGTPGFYPPERLNGNPFTGPSSDIFALGMTALVLLTGQWPYAYDPDEANHGSPSEQQYRQLQSASYYQNAQTILGGVALPIQSLLLQMIHPDPSTRFADYGHLLRAIEEISE